MKFDISKDNRQELSGEKWKNNMGVGGIDACPRFGKTQIGVKIIDKVRIKKPEAVIVILTPSQAVYKIWKPYKDKAFIYTSHGFILGSPIKIDLLIVDELHKFTSDNNIKLLKSLCEMSRFRLALSGTYPYQVPQLMKLFPVVDKVTEQEAIDKGWISPFVEYNIPVELTTEEKDRYIKYSRHISQTMELFRGKARLFDPTGKIVRDDLDFIFKLHAGVKVKGHYIHGSDLRYFIASRMGWSQDIDLSTENNRQINDYWNPNTIYERVKTFKNVVSYRNELLNNNTHKLELVQKLININPVPTIIFNDSIDFVNTIADKLGSKAIPYHSKIKSRPIINEETGEYYKYSTGRIIKFGATRLKNMAMDGIKSGEYKYLVTVKSLDEGLDLPELEQVIVTAGSANPLQQQQRTARAKTINMAKLSKVSRIFNLYVDDFIDDNAISHKSRDKSKLIQRQANYKHEVLWLQDLEQLQSYW